MRSAFKGVFVGVIAIVGLACGGSDDDPEPSSPTPRVDDHSPADPSIGAGRFRVDLTTTQAVRDACDRYAAAELAYESLCTTAIHPDKYAYYTDRYKLACIVAANEPGVVFDERVIDQCATALDEWKDAGCTNRPLLTGIRDALDVCKPILAGALAPGEACVSDAQCDSGRCMHSSDCGTCARRVGVGQPCNAFNAHWTDDTDASPFALCEEGAWCPRLTQDQLDAGLRMSTCVASGKVGADCDDLDLLYGQSSCAKGFECRYVGSQPRCVAPKSEGDACDETKECASDLVCRDHVCARYAAEGEACGAEGGGALVVAPDDCIGTLACSPSAHTCEAPTLGPLKGPGEPCGETGISIDECRFGGPGCLFEDSVCPSPPLQDGERCTHGGDCDAVSRCVAGVCQPLTTLACRQKVQVL